MERCLCEGECDCCRADGGASLPDGTRAANSVQNSGAGQSELQNGYTVLPEDVPEFKFPYGF